MKIEAGQREWVENLAKEAQEAADVNSLCKVYQITRTLLKKKFNNPKPICNKQGLLLFRKQSNCRHGKNIMKKYFKRMQ
jgi:hypothetical protein